MNNPILVNVYRGENIESSHKVHYVVIDQNGITLDHRGNVNISFYPRSAVKPLQALILLESGAVEKFSISEVELALACASHNAEKEHIRHVKTWLERIGLEEKYLLCGGHPPMGVRANDELNFDHQSFSSFHNNCSGKHTGILSTILSYNENPKDYLFHEHPSQIRIRKKMEDLMSYNFSVNDRAIDGCGIPTFFTPLHNLALGFAQAFKDINFLKIFNSMVNHPFYCAGTDRFCTKAMMASGGDCMVKLGAEGVYVAAIKSKKIAVALKVEDGALRASELAMFNILKSLVKFDLNSEFYLTYNNFKLFNWSKTEVGRMEVKI